MTVQTNNTGRFRVRTKKLLFCSPVLILQMQERTYGTVMEHDCGMLQDREVDYMTWRDIQVEDFGLLSGLGIGEDIGN